jgi:large subunit ribosomal protein L5
MNKMKQIYVGKLTLNVGAGRNQSKLEKGKKLITNLTGKEPVTTKAKKRIQGWNLRPGLPVGAKLTLRGKEAEDILHRLLYAKDRRVDQNSFDDHGNLSFGIPEYVDIEGLDYDTEIGMMGLQASITLKRPGHRIKERKIRKKSIPKNHRISQEQAIQYMKDEFDIIIPQEEEQEE